jgi:hypothetical protein
MGLSYFSMKTHSFNLHCGIYTRLCLSLSNASNNLTSLSALPLRSSPRSLYVSGSLMYPSLIFHHKFPSPANISHKNSYGAHCLELSHSLSTSGTILSWPALWIKSTFISANVSCHHNGFALYFKDTFSLYTLWTCATPTSVVTSPGNVLRRRIISHELAVLFDNHRASCSHMQWPSTLHQHSANAKITHPRMHLKRFVKFREHEHGRRRQLVLKLSKGLVTKLIPLLG